MLLGSPLKEFVSLAQIALDAEHPFADSFSFFAWNEWNKRRDKTMVDLIILVLVHMYVHTGGWSVKEIAGCQLTSQFDRMTISGRGEFHSPFLNRRAAPVKIS